MGLKDHECSIKKCKAPRALGYTVNEVVFGICDEHYKWHCADEDSPPKLRKYAKWTIRDHLDPERVKIERGEWASQESSGQTPRGTRSAGQKAGGTAPKSPPPATTATPSE